MKKELNFETAFKYPFNRPKGLLNGLWLLFIFFGWFALMGYGIRIINEFIKGKFNKLPEMNFSSDFVFGFIMFLKIIPFILVYVIIAIILSYLPFFGNILLVFIALFVLPILSINFFKKQTVSSCFEFELVRVVFDNFVDYLIVLVKSIILSFIFLLMSIVLIGTPANMFTKNMFLADFYRRHVK